jgi:MtN3 and saliva related transmembrane protein
MDYVELVGFAAAILGIVSFIPQVAKAYRTKSTKDLSWGMYIILCAGFALWLAYGIMTNTKPIIFANTVCLLFGASIMALKRKYG